MTPPEFNEAYETLTGFQKLLLEELRRLREVIDRALDGDDR